MLDQIEPLKSDNIEGQPKDNLQDYRIARTSPESQVRDPNATLINANVLPEFELCQAQIKAPGAPVDSPLDNYPYNPRGQRTLTEPATSAWDDFNDAMRDALGLAPEDRSGMRRRVVGKPNIEMVGNPTNIDQMTDAIGKLPPEVRQLLDEKGYKFVLTDNLRNHDPKLIDNQPTGWQQGSSWRNADGRFQNDKNEIVVASHAVDLYLHQYRESTRGKGVLLHETAHAVDKALGYFSTSKEFKDAYERDIANLSPEDRAKYAYYLTRVSGADPAAPGRGEAFADVWAEMNGSAANQDPELLAKFPNVKKAIEERMERLRQEQDAMRAAYPWHMGIFI